MLETLLAHIVVAALFIQDIHSDQCIPSDTFLQSISTSAPSSVLNITFANPEPPLNLISCETLSVSSQWTGGKLILSDSPEYPGSSGKLYEHHNLPPTTSNRIFMYHANGKDTGNMRFSVLIQNTSPNETSRVNLIKSGVAGPSGNYLYTGKVAAERWLRSTATKTPVDIPPLGIVQLDSTFHTHRVPPGHLLHGIWDYSITTSHSVVICSLDDSNDDPIELCLSSQLHPRDTHVRGTFDYADKALSYSVQSNPNQVVVQFPIGDGVIDEFISGIDATDGSVQWNSGNYGVAYKVPVRVPVDDPSTRVAYLVNPRGGIWSGVVELSGQVHLLPESLSSVRDNTQGVLIGSFDISNDGSVMTFIPVGGSSLPVRIALVQSTP